MTTSADLGISYLAAQQAQPEITHNTALNMLQILQTGVISVALNTPPGSPTQGDTYILGASPTGAWAGRAHCLAGYFGTGWVFVPGVDSTGTAIAMGARHEGLSVWSKADNAVYIWSGSAWAAASGGMTNPMTTTQDIIVGGASGTPGRLAIGTNGYVLTAVAGAVAWAVATGFANPMTTAGDIILGGASGAPGRLAIGTNGYVLTVSGGTAVWAANAAMTNPMTTVGDIIYGGASGVPTRLAAGSNTQVLTLAGGVPTWATPASGGMTNPMTTSGDIIYGGASGTPTRLAAGSNGQVLALAAGIPAWIAPTTSWEAVASWTYASDVANVDFTNLGVYSELMVVGTDISASVSGVRALIVSTDNGSTFYNTSGNYTGLATTGIPTPAAWVDTHDSGTSAIRSFIVRMEMCDITSTHKVITKTSGLKVKFTASTSPINAIRIYSTASGNLTGGTIYVYGKR